MSMRPLIFNVRGPGPWSLALFLGVACAVRGDDHHGAAHASPPAAQSLPAEATSTHAPSVASDLGALISTNLVKLRTPVTKGPERVIVYQEKVDFARELRRKHDGLGAARVLVELLENETPAEFKRAALFELALIAQDEKQLSRAQQILSQYLQLFPKDPSVPEVILRQGLIYRQMGANQLAVSKFYAVMSSALNMKLDRFDYYTRIVLQAQTEIADTHLLQGQFQEAAELYVRLLKQQAAELNRPFIQSKLLSCLASLGQPSEVVGQAESFEAAYPDAPELAEVRFLHAQSLKQLGRTRESLAQIAKLLEAVQAAAERFPENWVYWRQRVGNGIANQLYQEGDYLNALELYTNLAELDRSPGWQLPAWYQIALIHERLDQPQKAAATFDAILAREKEMPPSTLTPSLKGVIEMARWRKSHLAWRDKAVSAAQSLRLDSLQHGTNPVTLAQP